MARKKTTSKKTAVPAVKKEQTTDLTVFEGYDEFQGQGFENQTNEDVAIPFLKLLQVNSPEVTDNPDAEAGMFFNTVSQEAYPEVQIVPAITQHVFVAWKPEDEGGGIVATYPANDDLVKAAKSRSTEFGKYEDGNGNDLVETFYVAAILSVEDETKGMCMVAFTSTKIKAYKGIMARIRPFQIVVDDKRISPPMFAHLLTMTTEHKRNAKGAFYVPVITPALNDEGKPDLTAGLLPTEDIRFRMGQELRRMIQDGTAKADLSSQESERTPRAEDGDEDLPF
ncbi:MAG: hypothetical protein GY906_12245 [bacterium]|nr:hypothetical protein [bacterium]